MKKLLASMLALSFIILAGCSALPLSDLNNSSAHTALLTESDSESAFAIYPKNEKYSFIGKFDRPEYQNLTNRQRSIYIIMDNAAYKQTAGFIDLGEAKQNDVELAYNCLVKDRPEYFWLPNTYTLRTVGDTQQICFAETDNDWSYSKAVRQEKEAQTADILLSYINELPEGLSMFERELYAHDWLAENLTYDHTALIYPDTELQAWNITGAFLDGKVVCEGYAKAMQILLYMSGINCTTITGKTQEPHMWNLVQIDGDWYHLDLTADDGDNGVYHFFFNVTTEYILKSHTIDPLPYEDTGYIPERFNTTLPICTALKENYYIKNSLYIASADSVGPTVVSHICNAVRSGRRSVEFAVSPEIGFVFGQEDAADFFDLSTHISAANAELPDGDKLFSYYYGGVNGALGFALSW